MNGEKAQYNEVDKKYKIDKKDKIFTSYDIDGIFSAVSMQNIATSVRGTLYLHINCKDESTNKFLRYKQYPFIYNNDIVTLNMCYKKSIGHFFIPDIGEVNLFMIFPKSNAVGKSRNEKFLSVLEKIGGICTGEDVMAAHIANNIKFDGNNQTYRGIISEERLGYFFTTFNEAMIGNNDPFFYYIEVIGNKSSTSSDKLLDPITKLNEYIAIDKLPGLRIDNCVQIWSNSPNVITRAPKKNHNKKPHLFLGVKKLNGKNINRTLIIIYCL